MSHLNLAGSVKAWAGPAGKLSRVQGLTSLSARVNELRCRFRCGVGAEEVGSPLEAGVYKQPRTAVLETYKQLLLHTRVPVSVVSCFSVVFNNNFKPFGLEKCHVCIYWCANCIYTVSQNNDTDVAHYNFNEHQPILVIFGSDIAERVCYQMLVCYSPLVTNVTALPLKTRTQKFCLFSYAVYHISKTTLLWLAISSTLIISVSASAFTPGSTKNSSVQLSFETATDTISDEENVGRQRSRRSAAMSRNFALLGA